MDYTALGAAIRKKRIERAWKIAILADKVGVSEDFIGKIERATDIPSLQTVVAIANALEVGVDSLLQNDLLVVDVSLCDLSFRIFQFQKMLACKMFFFCKFSVKIDAIFQKNILNFDTS